MAILNITYNGLSVDYPRELGDGLTDGDIRRVAAELLRSGELEGLQLANATEQTFAHYVVDRLDTAVGPKRIYLRPKVPFGGARG
jgi:hypothetical protein